MADDAPEAPPRSAGKGIGSKLTKKLGPLPVWAWGLAVVSLGYLGYRYYASKQAASGAASASTAVGAGTTGSGAPDTSGGYSDGGSGQLAGLLSQLQTQLGTGGGGTGSQPGYSLLSNSAAIQAVRNAGQQLYEQLTPGVFTAYNGGVPTQAAIQAGKTTPLYALNNGSVQGTTPSGTPAGVSGAAAPTTNTSPAPGPQGQDATAPAGSPAGAVAVTTPAPAVSPITSGPQQQGTSLGFTPAVHTSGPLGPSGPIV